MVWSSAHRVAVWARLARPAAARAGAARGVVTASIMPEFSRLFGADVFNSARRRAVMPDVEAELQLLVRDAAGCARPRPFRAGLRQCARRRRMRRACP